MEASIAQTESPAFLVPHGLSPEQQQAVRICVHANWPIDTIARKLSVDSTQVEAFLLVDEHREAKLAVLRRRLECDDFIRRFAEVHPGRRF